MIEAQISHTCVPLDRSLLESRIVAVQETTNLGQQEATSWRGKDALCRNLRLTGLWVCWLQRTCLYSISPSAQDVAGALSQPSTGGSRFENTPVTAPAGRWRPHFGPWKKRSRQPGESWDAARLIEYFKALHA